MYYFLNLLNCLIQHKPSRNIYAYCPAVKSIPQFGTTTQYNMNRKTIRFILAVSAEHQEKKNMLYYNFYYSQKCGR